MVEVEAFDRFQAKRRPEDQKVMKVVQRDTEVAGSQRNDDRKDSARDRRIEAHHEDDRAAHAGTDCPKELHIAAAEAAKCKERKKQRSSYEPAFGTECK